MYVPYSRILYKVECPLNVQRTALYGKFPVHVYLSHVYLYRYSVISTLFFNTCQCRKYYERSIFLHYFLYSVPYASMCNIGPFILFYVN